VTPTNILSGGLLFNDYHSPYDGISPLVPQQSTTKRNTIAWLPYLRDQQSFHERRCCWTRASAWCDSATATSLMATALSKSPRSFFLAATLRI
jgi:hypothetical protein